MTAAALHLAGTLQALTPILVVLLATGLRGLA